MFLRAFVLSPFFLFFFDFGMVNWFNLPLTLGRPLLRLTFILSVLLTVLIVSLDSVLTQTAGS